MNQPSGGERNPDAIEQKGERDVLDHLAVAPAGDLAGNRQSIQTIRQDDDVRRFDRDIRAAAQVAKSRGQTMSPRDTVDASQAINRMENHLGGALTESSPQFPLLDRPHQTADP
jgi:hypothetical protein